jgi:hypothetical protein
MAPTSIVLMPSTPSACPQVVSRSLASFHVADSAVSQFSTIFARDSIPGSSTKEGPDLEQQVRAFRFPWVELWARKFSDHDGAQGRSGLRGCLMA